MASGRLVGFETDRSSGPPNDAIHPRHVRRADPAPDGDRLMANQSIDHLAAFLATVRDILETEERAASSWQQTHAFTRPNGLVKERGQLLNRLLQSKDQVWKSLMEKNLTRAEAEFAIDRAETLCQKLQEWDEAIAREFASTLAAYGDARVMPAELVEWRDAEVAKQINQRCLVREETLLHLDMMIRWTADKPGAKQQHRMTVDETNLSPELLCASDLEATKQASPQAENRLEREVGGTWRVVFHGQECHPNQIEGWDILARLLQKPHVAVNSLELEGHQPELIPRNQSDDKAIDDLGLQQVRKERSRFSADLEDAKKRLRLNEGDFEARRDVQNCQEELEKLNAYIIETCHPTGKKNAKVPRRVTAGNESAKAAGRIQGKLRTVKKDLNRRGLTSLASHLDQYVGQEVDAFAYRPSPPETFWQVNFGSK
jgi:hypothetical protein